MYKRVLASGAAIALGVGLAAGCSGEQPNLPVHSNETTTSAGAAPGYEKPGMQAVCKEVQLGKIVLNTHDQALFMNGDKTEQQKVRTTLRGTSVPHMMYVVVHSREELADNATYNAQVVGAIAHLVAPKVRPLAQNAEYSVTDRPDIVKPDYLQLTGTTVKCTRLPEIEVMPQQPVIDPNQPVSPLA
jgi:hypothetical protein